MAGLTINGMGAILLGAPGANGGNGMAYLVWGSGSSWNAQIGKAINLDSTTFNATYGLNEIVFTNTAGAGGKLGYSVAGGANILGDGASDVILGAPANSVDGQAGHRCRLPCVGWGADRQHDRGRIDSWTDQQFQRDFRRNQFGRPGGILSRRRRKRERCRQR